VRAVTSRAGVTPTALYLHFADKKQLLDEVKDRCFKELRRYVLDAEERAAPDSRWPPWCGPGCTAWLACGAPLPRSACRPLRPATPRRSLATKRDQRFWPPPPTLVSVGERGLLADLAAHGDPARHVRPPTRRRRQDGGITERG
jgi:AcrR family transcriptional regulator